MTTVDIVVIGTIAVVALFPLLKQWYKTIAAKVPAVAVTVDDDSLWRQKWVATLIDLQGELEERESADQVVLCRQLIWQMLGGEPSKK